MLYEQESAFLLWEPVNGERRNWANLIHNEYMDLIIGDRLE